MTFDPTSPEIAAAPWRTYAELREQAPVYALPGMPGAFAISRYDDVRAVLSDAETFSSTLERGAEPMLMVLRDGAAHDRLRRVSPPLERDRALSGDIAAAADAIFEGFFLPFLWPEGRIDLFV